jgi:HK97 family phage major capsid protein
MTSVIEAKNGMRSLAAKAAETVSDEKLTNAEKKNLLDGYLVDQKAYSETISVHEQAQRLMAGGEAAPEAKGGETEVLTRTLGQEIINSSVFKDARASSAKGGRYSFSSEIGTKVAGTVDEGTTISNGQLAGAAGVLSLPNYVPGIVDIRFAQLGVGELFAQGTTSSPIVSYVKEATETVGAAARAEKATTGQSDATFVRVNEQVGSISAFFKITDEMMQDVGQSESFLSNRLVAQVGREEENEVLNGTGYPALSGILGRSGLTTAVNAGTTGTIAAPMKLAEGIFKQRTAIRTTAFVEPDACVINPLDWQYMQLAKDGQGQYYAGGPFSGAYGNGGYSNVAALWGLKIVQSVRQPAGTALVGGFNECGQLFRRQGITVEMTNSNEDDFKNHLITVRAESRSALAIWRSNGFGLVTVTWA